MHLLCDRKRTPLGQSWQTFIRNRHRLRPPRTSRPAVQGQVREPVEEKQAHTISRRFQILYAKALESRLRSWSSLALTLRGHCSESHRSLTMLSSGRPSPSVAHAPRLWIVKQQNLRPQKRQVYASRDPRAADQSSIFTLKSWVSQKVLIIDIQDSGTSRVAPSTVYLLTARLRTLPLFRAGSGSRRIFCPVSSLFVQHAERHGNVGQPRHFDGSESAA